MKYSFVVNRYDHPVHHHTYTHVEYYDAFGRRVFPPEGVRGRPGYAADEESAQDVCDFMEWYDELPVGQRGSSWLTAARTVGSRAADALKYTDTEFRKYTPEELEIIADLRSVVSTLERWKRTGKPPKYTKEEA